MDRELKSEAWKTESQITGYYTIFSVKWTIIKQIIGLVLISYSCVTNHPKQWLKAKPACSWWGSARRFSFCHAVAERQWLGWQLREGCFTHMTTAWDEKTRTDGDQPVRVSMYRSIHLVSLRGLPAKWLQSSQSSYSWNPGVSVLKRHQQKLHDSF